MLTTLCHMLFVPAYYQVVDYRRSSYLEHGSALPQPLPQESQSLERLAQHGHRQGSLRVTPEGEKMEGRRKRDPRYP